MRLTQSTKWALVLTSALIAAACSSSSPATTPDGSDAGVSCPSGTCCAYQVPSGTDLTSATSFAHDIQPIFINSCVFSGCHNDSTGMGAAHVFLGSRSTPAGNSQVFADIVGTASTELPSMDYVKAGDLANSYLLHKIDGDQCLFNAMCGGASCGVSMPNGVALLDVATRDKLRRWIAEGAQNN